MTASPKRAAFTLVELLVVVGLMASLLGLLVTGLRPTGSSQVRQLSQAMTSAIISARTRAIGSDAGHALLLEPGGGLPNGACNSVFFGSVPLLISGSVVPFVLSTGTFDMPPKRAGTPPTLALSATSTLVFLGPANADASDFGNAYAIRFHRDPPSPLIVKTPWFFFTQTSGSFGVVTLRSTSSQTLSNTVWPLFTGPKPLEFSMARRPIKALEAAEPTKFAAIDLRYSGVGNTLTGDYGTLHGKGSVAIVFDRDGAFESIMVSGAPAILPLVPTAPLYLLIATVPDIEQNRALQSDTSRWLTIAPSLGRVTVSANVVVPGTTEADVRAARSNALLGATGGAR